MLGLINSSSYYNQSNLNLLLGFYFFYISLYFLKESLFCSRIIELFHTKQQQRSFDIFFHVRVYQDVLDVYVYQGWLVVIRAISHLSNLVYAYLSFSVLVFGLI